MPSALPLTIRLVRIEAVAGPVPPIFTEEDFDFDQEFKRLVEQTRDFTAQQAMDQVYRRPPLGLTPRPPFARAYAPPFQGLRTTFSCVFEGFSRELSSHYIINTNYNALYSPIHYRKVANM